MVVPCPTTMLPCKAHCSSQCPTVPSQCPNVYSVIIKLHCPTTILYSTVTSSPVPMLYCLTTVPYVTSRFPLLQWASFFLTQCSTVPTQGPIISSCGSMLHHSGWLSYHSCILPRTSSSNHNAHYNATLFPHNASFSLYNTPLLKYTAPISMVSGLLRIQYSSIIIPHHPITMANYTIPVVPCPTRVVACDITMSYRNHSSSLFLTVVPHPITILYAFITMPTLPSW